MKQGFYVRGLPVSDTNVPDISLLPDGIHSVLQDDFSYFDKSGTEHRAYRGLRTDGKSIPRIFWRCIGSPWTGKDRYAGIIHDQECKDIMLLPKRLRDEARNKADANWREMCAFLGDGPVKTFWLWVGVRAGWWCHGRWK